MDRDEVIEEITRAIEEGDDKLLDLFDDLVEDGILEFIGGYPIN